MNEQNKMGVAPMLPLVISMGLPAMFSMLVQALYNIVDSYFVAQYSTDALAAVSLAFPIQNLIIAFAVGTAVGVSSLVSRKLGEKNQKAADSAATHGVVLAVLSWVIFLVFGLVGAGPFYGLFESNPAIVDMGKDYLEIVCVFSIGIFIQCCFEKILQSTGNMVWPMIMQLVGAVLNIVLDPILIFGYLGFPAMGIVGAAIATVAAQIIAAIVTVIIMVTRDHEVSIKLKGFRFEGETVKNIYAVGLPAIIMNAIGTVMTMAMNGILATFSATAYTVYGVYFKLQSFVFMPIFGLTNGLMPIMGYNYGAKNRKRMMSALKIGIVISVSILAIATVAFIALPTQMLSIFNADESMYEIGVPAIRIMSVPFVCAAVGICISTLFQAVGKGSYSLINSVMRQLVVYVPAAYFLSKISLTAVWFASPIAELSSLAVTLVLFARLYRKEIKDIPEGAPSK